MPDPQIRKAVTGHRREGRRSHSAYGSHARRIDVFESNDRMVPVRAGARRRALGDHAANANGWSAGFALALVYPLMRGVRRAFGHVTATGATRPRQRDAEGAECMKRKPSIQSLETVSLEEAMAYLDHADGDELDAAYTLALDRNRLDGSHSAPDDAEVHHALFLLCRARGRHPPSYDEMRVELRRRVAA